MTKDPEVRYGGANNTAIASFSIAVDRKFKRDNEPTADFFNCIAFSKTAEFVEKYLKKGTKIVLEGRLQNDKYKNKDGVEVTATKIIVDTLEFAESKQASVEDQPKAPENADGFMDIPAGEELPFT